MITYNNKVYTTVADFIMLNRDIIELGENTKGSWIKYPTSTDWEEYSVSKLFEVLNNLNENKELPVSVVDVIQSIDIVKQYAKKTRIWDDIEEAS